MFNAQQVARWITDGIVSDISDRRGLSDEWDQIDDDVKEDIIESWTQMIVTHIEEGYGPEED